MKNQTQKFAGRAVAGTVLVFALVGAAGLAPLHLWDIGHKSGDRIEVKNPECPTMWDTIPLFPARELTELSRKKDSEMPAYFSHVPGSSALQFAPPNGELPAIERITNIPEFHDCQRLLASDQRYDSLFAIFASYRMDSVMAKLGWHVVNWSSSNSQVASITTAGVVEARKPGFTTIKATAVGQPSISASVTVTVLADSADSSGGTLSVVTGRVVAAMKLGESRQAVAQLGRPTMSTVAAATIYAFGPGYPALGIGSNFSCLYVYFGSDHTLRAKIVGVPSPDAYSKACKNEFDPRVAIGKELAVVRSSALGPGMSGKEYPAVARWDFDPKTAKHFIGLGCPESWCEIGAISTSGTFDPPEPYMLPASTPIGDRRVIQVKGWHDEQFLAVPGGPQPGTLKPSRLIGTVIPHPRLASVTEGELKSSSKKWTTVAYVALREQRPDPAAAKYYKGKLNLDVASVQPLGEKLNQLQYCYGNRRHCEVPKATSQGGVKCDGLFDEWLKDVHRVWVKVISAKGDVRYFCVTRRGHSLFKDTENIPSTSRWRWILSDETVWTECVQGCCETEG